MTPKASNGRLLMPAAEKDSAIVYDFVDHRNPIFEAQAKNRAYTYKQQGINTRKRANDKGS